MHHTDRSALPASSEDEQPSPSKTSRRRKLRVSDRSGSESSSEDEDQNPAKKRRAPRRKPGGDGEPRIPWTTEQKEFMLPYVKQWMEADADSRRSIKDKTAEEVVKKWEFPDHTHAGVRSVRALTP